MCFISEIQVWIFLLLGLVCEFGLIWGCVNFYSFSFYVINELAWCVSEFKFGFFCFWGSFVNLGLYGFVLILVVLVF